MNVILYKLDNLYPYTAASSAEKKMILNDNDFADIQLIVI